MATPLLLADDSPTIAKILTMALTSEPYDITTVMTASEAMQKLQESPPTLFLVDISLPEKDGLTFSRWIKSQAHLAHIKVVVLANAFDPVNDAACEAAGVDGIIVKPFDPSELRSRLRALGSMPAKKLSIDANHTPEAPPFPENASTADELLTAQSFEPPPSTTADDLLSAALEEKPSKAPSPAPSSKDHFLDINELDDEEEDEAKEEKSSADALGDPAAPLSEKAQELAAFLDAEVQLQEIASRSESAEKAEPQKSNFSGWSAGAPNSIFDTGDSSFQFSKDYINRMSKSLTVYEDDSHGAGEQPAVAAQPKAAAKTSAPKVAPAEKASKPVVTEATISEDMIREEVQKLVGEILPKIAEKVIREELAKILKSLEGEG
jgi:two-component system cell cycle response regulator